MAFYARIQVHVQVIDTMHYLNIKLIFIIPITCMNNHCFITTFKKLHKNICFSKEITMEIKFLLYVLNVIINCKIGYMI